MKYVLLSIGIVSLVVLLLLRLCCGIGFNIRCSQYLERASNANTVDFAKQNLATAMRCLEKEDLTNGVVSIFLHQPSNDIGYWYSNLRASMDELSKVKEDTSQLEKSNILMKLRETLTDATKEGTMVVCPSGISIYPYNALYFWLFMFSFVLLITGGLWCAFTFDNY